MAEDKISLEQEVRDYYRDLKGGYSKRHSQFFREIAKCALYQYPDDYKGNWRVRIDYSVFRNKSEEHLKVLLIDAYSNISKLEAIADFECNKNAGEIKRIMQAIAAGLGTEEEKEDFKSRRIFDVLRDRDTLYGTTDHVFDFITRIGRMIDNLYHMVADYYGINITNPRNFQRQVTGAVRSNNPELASYLTQRIQGSQTIAEFYSIRNNVVHDAPIYRVTDIDGLKLDHVIRAINDIESEPPLGYCPFVLVSQKEGKEEVKVILPYLYGLYDDILQTITRTVQLMLKPSQ